MQPKPTPKDNPQAEKKCMLCGTGSQQRVLLHVEYQCKESYVCAGCLPMVIHGSH